MLKKYGFELELEVTYNEKNMERKYNENLTVAVYKKKVYISRILMEANFCRQIYLAKEIIHSADLST